MTVTQSPQHVPPDPDFIAAIVFPPLMLLSGFVSYVLYQDYNPFAPEVLIGYTLLIAIGLVVGFLLARAGPTNLRAFGIGLLVLIYLDVHMNIVRTVVGFVQVHQWWLLRYVVFFLCLFLSFLIILSLRKKLASIVAVVFATLLISTVALPIEQVRFGWREVPALGIPQSDLPPIIHLVLDGHIGIEGVPEDIEGGPELRRTLEDFYSHWGFRVFGRAYSKYFMTYDSLSNMFNGTASATKASQVSVTHQYGKTGLTLNRNLYFEQIATKGYRTRIYQSDYLDFCQAAMEKIESCYVYSSASPQLIETIDLPITEKAELILGSYANDSGFYNAVRVFYRVFRSGLDQLGFSNSAQWERKNYEFSSLGVPKILQHLELDILSSPQGRMFFAHLLLPHGPYAWDKECRLRPDSDTWLSRRHEHENLLAVSNPRYRTTAYRIYFEQAHCLVSLLDQLFKSLEHQGLLAEATIIIHGDHGSRITIADPVDPALSRATTRDFIDAFSTLLAVRSPTVTPGYERDIRSIQSLFAEYILEDVSLKEDRAILLQTTSAEMVPGPMPSF